MKRLFLLLTLLGILGLLVQCKHDPIQPAEPSGNNPNNPNIPNPDPGDPCDPNIIYFRKDIMPILESNCNMSGCHGNGSAEDGVNLSSYDNVMNTTKIKVDDPRESDIYEVLIEKDPEERMPRGMAPLSAEKIALIHKWIEQGAQNLTCDDNKDTTCITDNMSFKNNILPIFQDKCTVCHSGAAPSAGIDLSVYSGVEPIAKNGKLFGAVNHTSPYPMPKGGKKLDQCKIDQIKSWIDAGAQNN